MDPHFYFLLCRFSWLYPLYLTTFFLIFGYIIIDWKYVEEVYGIKLFTDEFLGITHYARGMSRMGMPQEGDHTEVTARVVSAEEAADMHAFMKVYAFHPISIHLNSTTD